VNVLLLDSDSCGVDLAYRAAEAGHAVRLWQPKEKGEMTRDGEGFPGIKKVEGWKDSMQWAKSGLIVNLFNDKKLLPELDRYKEFGFPLFGPSAKSAALEINRAKGMKALEERGVKVPPYKTFNSLQEAEKYARTADKRLVFKVMGDNEDKSLSYCASDPKDMQWRIRSWIESGLTLKGPCMLQDFIEGIEVGVSAWMSKDGFLPKKYGLNWEFKKMMAGDFGPSTGEMGSCLKYVESSKLAGLTLVPMEEELKRIGHIGDVDLNCIVDKKGDAYCLEWTNRFGWPSTQIAMAMHRGDPIEWMKDALRGQDSLKVDDRCAIGVGMYAPPFPYPDEEGIAQGLRVDGLEDVWNNVSPWQLRIENGEYLSTGPYICVVTALGADFHDAIPQAYATVDKIKFPDRIVRNDVGKRLEKHLPELRALGYEEMPSW
jgi:phosphoribosylamine--glycine ligase